MLSEKVQRVLYKYEIAVPAQTTEAQAWYLISKHEQANRKPKPKVSVCFSGFTASRKTELVAMAERAGFHVSSSVAKSTTHLCCDFDHVGPKKMEKAIEQDVAVIGMDEFIEMSSLGY